MMMDAYGSQIAEKYEDLHNDSLKTVRSYKQ